MKRVWKLDWEKMGGLLPAVAQDAASGQVLMLAYMNEEALSQTLETGHLTFWSRSRRRLWTKGESSGNRLKLVELRPDCDGDALLALVEPAGPACHRGTRSCFAEDSEHAGLEFLVRLNRLIAERRLTRPESSYTATLFHAGREKIAQKFGEEAVEVVVSAFQDPKRLCEESADLLYHWLVLLAEGEVELENVVTELARRHKIE